MMINNYLHDIFKKELQRKLSDTLKKELQGKLSPDPGTRKCTIKNKKKREREREREGFINEDTITLSNW